MEGGGVLGAVNLFLFFSRLLILDVFDALASDIGEGVGDLLAGLLPVA